MSDLILSELKERVLTVRINRAEKKNALTQQMYSALAALFTEAAGKADVRAVLLTGSADSFSSGNDVLDFLKTPAGATLDSSPVGHLMHALADFPKPVVAAVNGLAIGIGFTAILHCDLVYAAENARFQAPFVNLGICAEFASTYLLPRLIGHARTAELLMFGEPFSAQTAHAYGLVNAVLPSDQLLAHAQERARKLADQPPNAMRVTKKLIRHWSKESIDASMQLEAQNFLPMLHQPEAREVMSAFMAKRKPDFSKFA